MNLPNKLTLMRIILIPIFMVVLYWGFPGANYVALAIFVIASLTDWLDGKIARSRNLVTDFGKFADPLADKMLVTAAMLWFVETGRMPAWALLIVICREFAVSGLRMIASDKGKVIAAGWSGKVKTASTMVCIILMFLIPSQSSRHSQDVHLRAHGVPLRPHRQSALLYHGGRAGEILRYQGYNVKRVMNITDVGHLTSDADTGEDKMLKGARREHKTVLEIAQYYTDAFFDDCRKLNIKRPDVVEPATHCIDDYIRSSRSSWTPATPIRRRQRLLRHLQAEAVLHLQRLQRGRSGRGRPRRRGRGHQQAQQKRLRAVVHQVQV
jgi:CDP-diacylglycerol--glycerol-3-phosphate 3-phosphatidyltransferase